MEATKELKEEVCLCPPVSEQLLRTGVWKIKATMEG